MSLTTVVTRRYRFAASHRLHMDGLSVAENITLYGKCNNPFGHGHDYILDVSVAGSVDPATGKMFGLDSLDRLVQTSVLSQFEHRNINHDLPEFRELVPTTENISLVIAGRLQKSWGLEMPITTRLARIYIGETARNSFEVDCGTLREESIHV